MSKLKAFLRRDWAEFKREFFVKPSLRVVAPLIIVGIVLLVRAYLRHRQAESRIEAVTRFQQQDSAAADRLVRELEKQIVTNK
jgi:uncharacterized membrane protein YidH (DUF202 family)